MKDLVSDGFSVADAIKHILEDDIAAKTSKFLDKALKIQITTA